MTDREIKIGILKFKVRIQTVSQQYRGLQSYFNDLYLIFSFQYYRDEMS